MKNTKKLLLFFLVLLLTFSLTMGCSSKQSNDSPSTDSSGGRDSDFGAGSMPESSEEEMGFDEKAEDGSKVITTMFLSFETTEFDKTNDKLNTIMKKYEAYVENSNISYDRYYNGKNYKYGEFSIRVPKNNLLDFKGQLAGIGNLTSESTNKEDVTKYYRDTESRLRVITTKEARILALLEKAEKMEDIIVLENQLSEVIYEKESLQSSLIGIDNKVDYSTINLNIREVEKLSDQETVETGFLTRVKNAFNNSLYGFNTALQDFLIWLIYSLPFIVIIAVCIYLGYRVFRRIQKNKS